MKAMDQAEPLRDDGVVADLSAAARACADARLRGVILALASLHEGLGLRDAARIWGVDPTILGQARQRFEESGLDGLTADSARRASLVAPRRGRP